MLKFDSELTEEKYQYFLSLKSPLSFDFPDDYVITEEDVGEMIHVAELLENGKLFQNH